MLNKKKCNKCVTFKIKCFLLCFSMNSRDFSVKSKLIISLFQTMKIRLSDFHSLELLFSPLFYGSSAKILAQKV